MTGRAAEEWKLAETELPAALKTAGVEVQDSCRKLAPLHPPHFLAEQWPRIALEAAPEKVQRDPPVAVIMTGREQLGSNRGVDA